MKSTHTLPRPPLPPPILISKKFRSYDKAIRDVWETYQFLRFYAPILHNLVKTGKVPRFVSVSLGKASGLRAQNPKNTIGTISHLLGQVSPQRSVISSVAHTESFLQYLMIRVLRDHPQRLLSGSQIEQGPRELKLLDIVINSSDKWEMLDRVIEERVRGLFYGAPSDFFLKDKAKLEFGDYFRVHCPQAIESYTEITARRNLLMHNDGRIDRKYLREIPSSTFVLGQKVTIDETYLKKSLFILRGLCAIAGVLVCERIYNNKVPSGVMLERKNSFAP